MSFPVATIDAAALRSNLAVVRRMAPRSKVVAVVKANGYGHGMIRVARAVADQVDSLGVARLPDAIALREAGVRQRILLLEGVFGAEQFASAAQRECEIVVHSSEQLTALEQFDGSYRFVAWLKLNSGMNRLGFLPSDFLDAFARLRRCAAVSEVRVMTHLSASEERDGEATHAQLKIFNQLAASLPVERSIANSAAVIAWPESHADWIRPGLIMYGMSPLADTSAEAMGLKPAMTLSTHLIGVQDVPVGGAVGYNGLWRAQRPSRIGIAAIGYGDGYPRTTRSGAPVLVDGHEAPLAGRVSMDMIAIDITDLPRVRAGAHVVLWGEGLPAERVAPYSGTTCYELVCRVMQRVASQDRAPAA